MSEALSTRRSSQKRKKEHLDIALTRDVSSASVSTGFEDYAFVHQALPEINLADVDTSIRLFGKALGSPIVISSMVGGIDEATPINRNLAIAAQELGLAMGVGSQRPLIEEPETLASYDVRDVAPDILLFANLGAVQLNHGYDVTHCQRIVDIIEADALLLHLNPLHEALQPEGDTAFAGLLAKIEKVCRAVSVPVIVKEVGFGISAEVASKLVAVGVAGIDVAGSGGTSFSQVERWRTLDKADIDTANAFVGWGIPTADSLKMVRHACPEVPLIASGGLRTGVDVAKALVLGADGVGIASPLLKPASISDEEVIRYLKGIIRQLRISMFCIGASCIGVLKDNPHLQRK